jgi:lipid A 4'-phosphatase
MNEQPAALCDAAAAPTPGSGARRDAPGVALVCLAGMAATVVFVSWPEIDLGAARLFVDESHRFFLARHPMPRLFNTLIDVLAVVLIVSSLGGLAYTGLGRRTLAGHGPRAYAFILASVTIGPGLIANALFKNQWGRARPRQIIEFGGTADFTPALAFADQCARNCSFVAGDASLAFVTLAVALLAPAATRARWIALAILFGAFIGFIRIIQGAHFLSDVVFAGIFRQPHRGAAEGNDPGRTLGRRYDRANAGPGGQATVGSYRPPRRARGEARILAADPAGTERSWRGFKRTARVQWQRRERLIRSQRVDRNFQVADAVAFGQR